ncbi:uncharacterized protein LOC130670123 [Microplitis mediator]|uniref:uncharacterized protein LOC130670123 n=1 Tax=Microplitis mediator TaxID=375433 RepID=UPI002553CEDD|nr:uncharacterized protein LOC130670123 [Microplitis mediator]
MRTIINLTFAAAIFMTFDIDYIEGGMTVDQIKSFMKPIGKKCREKIGLDPELQAGQHRGEFPEDEKLMCYHACLYDTVKVTDKNGVANADVVIRQMEIMFPEGIKQIGIAGVKKCNEQFHVDDTSVLTPQEVCRANYNYMKCYYMEAHEAFFFP